MLQHGSPSIFTHVSESYQTWIDHVLTKNVQGFQYSPTSAVSAIIQLHNHSIDGRIYSDHHPLIVSTRLSPAAHRLSTVNLRPPLSTALFNAKHKQQYQVDMEQYVLKLSLTTPVAAAKSLQSVAAYSSSLCRQHHRTARMKATSNAWSPELHLIRINLAFLRAVLNIVKYALTHPQQPWYTKYHTALTEWHTIHSAHVQRHSFPDVSRFGTTPNIWHRFTALSDVEAQLILAAERCQAIATQCQNRLLRQRLQSIASTVSTALGENKLKTVIGITSHKKKSMVDLAYVVTNHNIILDPAEVHQTCTQHFHRHHSLNPTVFPDHINWVTQASVVSAKPQFEIYCHSHLPTALHWTTNALWHGFTAPWTDVSDTECTRRITNADAVMSPCPTLSEFTDAIRRSPASSPGVSGLSFSHIKLWSPPTVKRIHELLCMLWNHHHFIPDHWHWKLLCPIPKADKDPQNLENLRPIMLVECLRKLWVGIVIRRLSVFLTQQQLLSPSQHGYVAHRSTVTSGLQLLDNIDDFSENRIDLYLSSWDFTKAFDSLPFSLSRLAMQRAFIPADIADWLLQLDMHGRIIVRTPYALDKLRTHQLSLFQPLSNNHHMCYFKAGGGVAQGDVHGPYVWRLFIDILLRALEYLRPTLVPFPSIATSDFGYADDIISLASSLLDLQQKADIVSAFSIITGISISWSKLRATCHEHVVQTDAPSLTVWDKNMVSHTVPLVRGQTIRHLGFQVSTVGDTKVALTTTASALKTSCDNLLRRTRWLPSEAVFQTAALQTVAQTTYTTQLSTYTAPQLHTLDSSLFKVYRTAAKHWPTFPSAMLHINKQHCGLGLPAISTATYNAKHRILQRSLHHSTLGDSIICRYLRYHGIHPTLHYECTVPDPSSRPSGASGYWLDNLLQQCHNTGLILRRGGYTTALTSETQLVQRYPEHRDFWIREGLLTLGDLYDPVNHRWMRHSHLPRCPLPPIDHVTLHHSLRVGQCWRTTPSSDVVHEIINIFSSTDIHTRVWRLIPPSARGSTHKIQLVSHHKGPISHAQLFTSDIHPIRIYTHKDKLVQGGTVTQRLIWYQQPQPVPTIPTSPTMLIVDDILRQINQYFNAQPIRIYTDGSWKSTGSGAQRALLLSSTSVGGGSLVVLAASPQWKQRSALVFSIADDGTSPTAHAYTWELMALATASMIQSRYEYGCELYSDCTSAIHTIMHASTTSALLDQHTVILYPVTQLSPRPTVHHIAAHPEIHIGSTRPWTQHEWGIHLADMAASHMSEINDVLEVPLIISTIQSSHLLSDFHRIGTWTWCYASNTPILVPISTIWQQHTLQSYLQNRDQNQLITQFSVPWQPRSWRLTALIHQFASSTTSVRSRLQRILLHWSGIGVNLHREVPMCAESLCPHCHVPESEQHLLSACNDPIISQHRLDATLAAARYLSQHAAYNPIANFMQSMHAAREVHPHGFLLYFGFVTESLASTLPTYPNNDLQVQQLQKTVVNYLRILSQGGINVIDHARVRRHLDRTDAHPPSIPRSINRPVQSQRQPTVAPRKRGRPSTQPTARSVSSNKPRNKRSAHEAGLPNMQSKPTTRITVLTDYFSRQTISTAPVNFDTVPPHDHAEIHPP